MTTPSLVKRDTASSRYVTIQGGEAYVPSVPINIPITVNGATFQFPVNIPPNVISVTLTMCLDCGSVVGNVDLHDNFRNLL